MSEKHNVVLYGDRHNSVLFGTLDPKNPVGLPGGTPALTTLLYKVCDQNNEKFDEACRLICLFLDKKAEMDGQPLKKLERLMGYVQNGTDGIVSLMQDDVTMSYGISRRMPGRVDNDWVTMGASLENALNEAYNEHKDDCE